MVHCFCWRLRGMFKFKFLLFLLSFDVYGIYDKDCIDSIFKTEITHKGWPFGLTENRLIISKDKCVIVIDHEKLKFLKKKWTIDVCRGPVHIKTGINSHNVLKKDQECFHPEIENEFCQELKQTQKILQDDGLIFANGEKEDISSDHGQVYCSYLLLQTYLQDGMVLNRKESYENLLKGRAFSPQKEVSEKKDPLKDNLSGQEDPHKGKTGEF